MVATTEKRINTAKTKLTFRLHKTAIILICLALMVCLLQGVSYFSRVHQQSSMDQFNELAYSLAQQVAFNLSDAIDDNGKCSIRNKLRQI